MLFLRGTNYWRRGHSCPAIQCNAVVTVCESYGVSWGHHGSFAQYNAVIIVCK
jgi:hypothetical protein